MGNPIICLDFDGVVHSYTSGWKGARNIPDPPNIGAIEFIYRVICDGKYDVVIHSSRARYWGGVLAMRAWLKEHAGNLWNDGPGYTGLESVRFSRWKPPALLTIDDRAVQFMGMFPKVEQIQQFRPWQTKNAPEPINLRTEYFPAPGASQKS